MDYQITSTIDLEVSLGERERHRRLINAIFLITRDKNWSCPREPFRRVHLVFLPAALAGISGTGASKDRAKAVKYMYTA